MNTVLNHFKGSIWFAVFSYTAAFFSTLLLTDNSAFAALITVVVLSLTEIALSVDNAVVNASVLKHMSDKWQRRFLTWGIFFAVFVVRFALPIAIVSFADGLGFIDASTVAFTDPERFKTIMENCHLSIMAFGGIFLMLVALDYFLDSDKEVNWLFFEKYLSIFSNAPKYMIMFAASVFMLMAIQAESDTSVMIAGAWGAGIYAALLLLKTKLGGGDIALAVAKNGLIGFLYLEVLDSSFSFDGVVAAFALTNIFWEITLGLTVGSVFVRSATTYLVKHDTLSQFEFLEPAAYLSIAFLFTTMFLSIYHIEVGEVVIGLTSLGIIVIGVLSSIKHQNKEAIQN